MQFKYRVIADDNTIKDGTLEAVDLDAARRVLLDSRWQIIKLEDVPEMDRLFGRSFQSKIKPDALAGFSNQLAMLIRSGVNMVRSLDILQSQMGDKRIKEIVRRFYTGVSRGSSLAQAMRDSESGIPELLISLVGVGEESGNLDSVLISMSAYYERDSFVRKKIASAMVYPIVLTFVLIGLVVLFMNFILPEMSSMLKSNNTPLPLITQLMLSGAAFLTQNWIFILAGFAALVLGLRQAFKIPRYKLWRDAFLLRLPIFGPTIKDSVTARFSRTMALFLHSSIPIVPIFNSMEGVLGNEVARKALLAARERVIRGDMLYVAFGEQGFFDPLVIQMMMVGEETGRLEELMDELANHYEKLVEIGIGRLIALVEPAFTLIIGLFAGTLIISIALPIFSMSTAVH
jgi:type IV pilus assembly protein PilC